MNVGRRLLDEEKSRKKMLSIKMDRKAGKIALYESKITRQPSITMNNSMDQGVGSGKR